MDRRVIILERQIVGNLQARWTVATMAKTVSLSNSHLRKIFRHETGKSPARFVREIKLKEACKLLQEGVLRIKEIASEVGFHDQSVFTRNFTKLYGDSPSAYRKNYWFKRETYLTRD